MEQGRKNIYIFSVRGTIIPCYSPSIILKDSMATTSTNLVLLDDLRHGEVGLHAVVGNHVPRRNDAHVALVAGAKTEKTSSVLKENTVQSPVLKENA